MTPTALSWAPRWPPLQPEFVVARDAAALGLARELLLAPARLAALRGVVSGRLLVLTGLELPWVDGAEYYGRDGASPWLLMPTHRAPVVPTSWLEWRYRSALPRVQWPCLLVSTLEPERREVLLLLPVGGAASLDATRLDRWCAGV